MHKSQPKRQTGIKVRSTKPTISKHKTKSPATKLHTPSSRTITTSNHTNNISFSTSPINSQPTTNNLHQSILLSITPHTVHTSISSTPQQFKSTSSSSTQLYTHSKRSLFTSNQYSTFQTKSKQLLYKSHPFSTLDIQNASFFTDVVNSVKNAMSSKPTDEQSTTTTSSSSNDQNASPLDAPEGNPGFQVNFNDLTKIEQDHIQNVMTKFNTFCTQRERGAQAAITGADKYQFSKTLTEDEYMAVQYEKGSCHFFQLPLPTKPRQVTTPSPPPQQQQQSSNRIPLDPNSPGYQEMMDNHNRRYHEGELNAKMELRKAQMIKDSTESGVFTLSFEDLEKKAKELEDIQNQYENNPNFDPNTLGGNTPTKEFRLIRNPDGSIGFEDSSSKPIAKPASEPTLTNPDGSKVSVPVDGTPTPIAQIDDPRLLISFVCDMCKNRNVKSIPKRSYLRGVVLIRCDCNADHLISDRLGWFDDSGTIEEILKNDKNEDVFIASVFDMNKNVRNKNDSENGDDQGKEIGKNHITPEMLHKIEETLRIAREQDENQTIPFKHFHQQDLIHQQLDELYKQNIPMLPAGKLHQHHDVHVEQDLSDIDDNNINTKNTKM